MLRNEGTVERIFSTHVGTQNNYRVLIAITKIISISHEEELVANSLKIIRSCITNDKNHEKANVDYPDMINDLIIDTYMGFKNSQFIDDEMNNILKCYTRKNDFLYLIKIEALQ